MTTHPSLGLRDLGPIVFFMPNLAGGGAEKVVLLLAEALAERGFTVDLVVHQARGAYRASCPAGVKLVELERRSKLSARVRVLRAFWRSPGPVRTMMLCSARPIIKLQYLHSLVDYLEDRSPAVVIAALHQANLMTMIAARLTRRAPAIVLTCHNALSRTVADRVDGVRGEPRWRRLPALVNQLYPAANALVAVSEGAADDLAATASIDRSRIRCIYNPVVSQRLLKRAAAVTSFDSCSKDTPPLVLAAGRLEPQKQFLHLIEAFARVRRQRPARLVILGQGWQRELLQARARALGLEADVELPGWVDNPYAIMRAAQVFVLSSAWEGLGNVLIEAMACGCPVVSTDCPSGPDEILAGGQFGTLVPISDVQALADSIDQTLMAPTPRPGAYERALEFSVDNAVDAYLSLIQQVARHD